MFVQSLYWLNPYFLYFLYCTVLIYFPFFHPRFLLWIKRIWYYITFFQLEDRCSNCNHFYWPHKTERCKCKNRGTLSSKWCPQSLSFEKQSLADVLQNRCLKNFANFHLKTPVLESLCNKVAGLRACNFIKKRLQRMFSCEICEIFKNTYFEKHLRWLLLSFIRCSLDRLSPAWRFS